MGVDLVTFGCRLNTYESEVMRGRAVAAGLEDAVVVNTCTVTAEAGRQARQAVRRARRERPGARIVVAGCGAQVDTAAFAGMPEVDAVLGNAEKLDEAAWRRIGEVRVQVGDIASGTAPLGHRAGAPEGRTRAFVQVQQGCDHRCTFCIIPYARGPNRSVPAADVLEEARRLLDAGHAELVLTGVDITGWGADLDGRPALGRLVRLLLDGLPGLRRLRLSSVDPVEVDDELFDLLAGHDRLMPHLHLSLQAGDDMVLKRMRRRHLRDDAIGLCDRLRAARPDIAFGADLIAGFPTETEAMFAQSLAIVADCGLTWLHVFPYSERPGTPAARMPAVDRAVRKERAARLRAAGEAARDRFLAAEVGAVREVLVEQAGTGRTPQFALVDLDGGAPAGSVRRVRVTGHAGGRLIAEAAA